ncbi:DinB family protein [Brevibacillus choshinensis]|uniref:DinB family protein n=1 Tax=Brevibacillus choshinensis TaxID=54911 RepID=A0ABX7FQL6_BRECH|nr:DinB family protein [Brevibacillus choshinensis]QRG68538.1 DinB family protein [Brevibacillus choshinensis]
MTAGIGKCLRTMDFAQSLRHYDRVLEFQVEQVDESREVAVVVAPAGEPIVLAGLSAGDLSEYLADRCDAPQPGQSLYLGAPDGFHAYRDRLLAREDAQGAWYETEWGWEKLTTVDPTGYVLTFWGGRTLTDEQILHYYDIGCERLQAALAGLEEHQLDLVRSPGKWSIRQLVLHLVDSEATSLAMAKFALAEPGRDFNGNAYDPDVWAAGLDYAGRSIAAEVALFGAIRSHMSGLLRHLPAAWDRSVRLSSGQTVTVRQRIEPLMGHALHHIEQIWETRRAHGLS